MEEDDKKEDHEDTRLLKNSHFAGFYWGYGQADRPGHDDPIHWRKMGKLERNIGFWVVFLLFGANTYISVALGYFLISSLVYYILARCLYILWLESLNDYLNGKVRD